MCSCALDRAVDEYGCSYIMTFNNEFRKVTFADMVSNKMAATMIPWLFVRIKRLITNLNARMCVHEHIVSGGVKDFHEDDCIQRISLTRTVQQTSTN